MRQIKAVGSRSMGSTLRICGALLWSHFIRSMVTPLMVPTTVKTPATMLRARIREL